MDIAELGFRADTSTISKAERDLRNLTQATQRTERQIDRLGTTSSRSFSRSTGSAQAFTQALNGPGLRNVSLQLSQVAQQASATGDPLRALAIQLPDLTLGFGPLGIAAGVAAGAMLPLIANTIEFDTRGRQMAETIETIEQAVKEADRTSRQSILGFSEAVELDAFDQLNELLREEGRLRKDINAVTARDFGSRRAQVELDTNLALQEQLKQQIELLNDVVEGRDRSLTLADETADAERLLGLQMQETAQQAALVAYQMQLARDAAMAAAREFITMQDIRARFAGEDVVMSQPVISVGQGTPEPSRPPRRRTGGGGISQADQKMNEMLRERDRILDSLKTAQDRYNDSVSQADRLLQAGVLAQTDFNRYLGQLQDELDAVQFEQLHDGIADISDAFGDAIARGEDLGDAFRGVLQQMASDLISSGINGLLTDLLTPRRASGGGLLGGLFAGFFDGGGDIPSGQFGIVGERGPEIVTGPAHVTSRADTARAMQGAQQHVVIDLQVPEGVTASEAEYIAGAVSVRVVEQSNRTMRRQFPDQQSRGHFQ